MWHCKRHSHCWCHAHKPLLNWQLNGQLQCTFLHKASWKSNCCVSTRIQKLCSIASFIAISRQDRHLLLASNIVVSKVSCIKCMGHAGAKERNLRCNRQPRTATKAETLMINKNRLRILLYHNMRALPHESSHLPF